MKHVALIVIFAFGVVLGGAPSAQALSISLTGTGTITGAGSPFAPGDPFSLTIQYDTAALDVFPGDPTYGLFPAAITALSFTSGAFAATAHGGNVLVNDDNDYVLFLTTATEGLMGGAIGGWPLKMLSIMFDGSPLTSDTLTSLTTNLLMQMPGRTVSLLGCRSFSGDANASSCLSGAEAIGTISTVSVVESSAVPEPGSMLLFGTGASVLAMRRRRRQTAAQ